MNDHPNGHGYDDRPLPEAGTAGQAPGDPEAATPPPTPAACAVPPMQPSALAPQVVQAAWPTVLGVLSIVLGALWLLSGVWAIVAPIVLENAFGGMADQQMTWYSSSGAWRVGLLSVAVLSAATSVLLLIGGINLVRRKGSAVTLLIVWSVAMIVVTCVNIGMYYALQDVYVKQIASQAQGVPGGNTTMVVSMNIGLFCGLLINLAGPVFVLWWFRRAVIKREVATWT